MKVKCGKEGGQVGIACEGFAVKQAIGRPGHRKERLSGRASQAFREMHCLFQTLRTY